MILARDYQKWQRRHEACVAAGTIWAVTLMGFVLFVKKSSPLGYYRPEILVAGTIGFCIFFYLAMRFGERRSD